jgi:hypothetical protein
VVAWANWYFGSTGKIRRMKIWIPVAAVWLVALAAGPFALIASPDDKALALANQQWAEGDYTAALNGYVALLNGADGERYLEPIALQTGELYRSKELTSDGRSPRFSADGRFIAYETGLEVSRRTIVVRNDRSHAVVAELPGVSATFSPTRAAVAYLKIVETPELVAAATAVDAAPLAGQNRGGLVQALTYQVMRGTAITIRDLETQQERELPAPDLLKTGLVFAADGRSLYFLGGTDGDQTRNDLYVVAEQRPATRVGDGEGLKGIPIIDPGGAAVLYVVGGQNPFRRPQPPGAGAAGG